jgi:hypothetical protein
MDNLPLAAVLAVNAMNSTARSALPDAPVVPDDVPRRRPALRLRVTGPRRALARSLERLARAVAPAPNRSTCHPAA